MKIPTSTRLSCMAVVASFAVNLMLFGALRVGFDVPSADAASVVHLPSVTVVDKRLNTPDNAVAQTAQPLPSSAHVKL